MNQATRELDPGNAGERKREMQLLFTALLLIGPSLRGANEFKVISSFAEINGSVEQGTLIVLDLDETVMKPVGHVGSFAWYDDYVRYLKDVDSTVSEFHIHAQAMRVWNRLQSLHVMQPLDPDVSHWISRQKKNGAHVIALTARRPEIADVTHAQLNQIGVQFSRFASVKQGVLFAGEFTPKGEVLARFLDRENLDVTNVVFVDDSRGNLESVRAMLTQRRVSYSLFQFRDLACEGLVGRSSP